MQIFISYFQFFVGGGGGGGVGGISLPFTPLWKARCMVGFFSMKLAAALEPYRLWLRGASWANSFSQNSALTFLDNVHREIDNNVLRGLLDAGWQALIGLHSHGGVILPFRRRGYESTNAVSRIVLVVTLCVADSHASAWSNPTDTLLMQAGRICASSPCIFLSCWEGSAG